MMKSDKEFKAKDFKQEYNKIISKKTRLENLIKERIEFLLKEHPDLFKKHSTAYFYLLKQPLLLINMIDDMEKILEEKYSKIKQTEINFECNIEKNRYNKELL